MKIQSSSRLAVLKACTRFLPGLGVFFVSFALVTSNALAEASPTIGVTVTPDSAFQALFESYGNDNTLPDDWTGADGVLSVLLPDGRVCGTSPTRFSDWSGAMGRGRRVSRSLTTR